MAPASVPVGSEHVHVPSGQLHELWHCPSTPEQVQPKPQFTSHPPSSIVEPPPEPLLKLQDPAPPPELPSGLPSEPPPDVLLEPLLELLLELLLLELELELVPAPPPSPVASPTDASGPGEVGAPALHASGMVSSQRGRMTTRVARPRAVASLE